MSTNVTTVEEVVNPVAQSAISADELLLVRAGAWGYEDAIQGKRRGGEMFTLLSPEYNRYHRDYNQGLHERQRVQGDVCQAALDEAAWFDEIAGAGEMGSVAVVTGDDMEEWIGQAFSTQPYNY